MSWWPVAEVYSLLSTCMCYWQLLKPVGLCTAPSDLLKSTTLDYATIKAAKQLCQQTHYCRPWAYGRFGVITITLSHLVSLPLSLSSVKNQAVPLSTPAGGPEDFGCVAWICSVFSVASVAFVFRVCVFLTLHHLQRLQLMYFFICRTCTLLYLFSYVFLNWHSF